MATNRYFFFLILLHLPHLFTFSLTLQLPFSLYKSFLPLFISLSLIELENLILSQTLSSSPMTSKIKKTSYMISCEVFNLTH